MTAPILFAWIGSADLRAARGEDDPPGPIAQAVAVRTFGHLVLLCNYPADQGRAYVNWLSAQTKITLEWHPVALSSPVHFGDIYQAVRERPEDLAMLIDALWTRIQRDLAAEPDWTPKTLAAAARQRLLAHPWPGNYGSCKTP